MALPNAPLYLFEKVEQYINIDKIKALILPYNSLGSSIVLNAIEKGVKVYAVQENKSILKITKDNLKKPDIKNIIDYKQCYNLLKDELYEIK